MANTEYRDAVRILFLLVEGSVKDPGPDTSPGYPRRFEGETRLQALDFWVRYPDYLADELLAQYQESGDKALLEAARTIFDDNEPSEKGIPMLRRYFGAYEPLDTVLSILAVAGLVRPVTVLHPTANPRHFLLSEAGIELAGRIVKEHSIFEWYAARAKLVLKVAGSRGGNALKVRQHQQKEYHEAQLHDLIPTIAARVRARLEEIEA